jgi:DNA-directed RNA polymerase subunit beta'
VLALKRNGEIIIMDKKGREVDRYKVPYGAIVARGGRDRQGEAGAVQWDPHFTPILAEKGAWSASRTSGGRDRREEVGRRQKRMVVIEHKGDMHPQIIIEDSDGKILDFHYLPEKAHIEVEGRRARSRPAP